MSRLESFIRRLCAQRDCLNWVCGQLGDRSGHVLELGLGNGRTYDHLRHVFADREIFVFERKLAAHPDCLPDDDHCFLGDFSQSLPKAAMQLSAQCCLVHADIGSGDTSANAALAKAVAPLLPPFLVDGAFILSDQPMVINNATQLPLPDGIRAGRYYLQQYHAA